MDLNLIHLFVEIVEARSFTAAAQKLGMTRSNLSNRLKVLERETGAQLLRRSTRSLELTQAGETLFEHGRRMLQEVETARASIDGLGQTVRGHVRSKDGRPCEPLPVGSGSGTGGGAALASKP